MNRFIQGNCLTELAQLQPNSINCLITDPPYGNAAAYYGGKTIVGDEHPLTALAAVAACYGLLKRNSTAYVFTDWRHTGFMSDFIQWYTDFTIKDLVVWDKMQIGMGRGFRKRHEFILVLEKGKPEYNSRSVSNVLPFRNIINKEHPHEKPIPLLKQLIGHSTQRGDLILDPFAGSGSSCIAARQLGRQFIGIEIDPRYAAMARSRIQEGK